MVFGGYGANGKRVLSLVAEQIKQEPEYVTTLHQLMEVVFVLMMDHKTL